MNPYFWMTDFTPQKEWIDGKGLLLWLAFFFSEIGAGVYVVSLFLEFRTGCVAGWIACALLGGGLHTAYLGKPERAWRAILRPGSSELSRGIIILGTFSGGGRSSTGNCSGTVQRPSLGGKRLVFQGRPGYPGLFCDYPRVHDHEFPSGPCLSGIPE